MYYWRTEIRAIDPKDGQLKTWAGPNVMGTSIEEARLFCAQNGCGFCDVIEKVSHIQEYNTPGFDDAIDRLQLASNGRKYEC